MQFQISVFVKKCYVVKNELYDGFNLNNLINQSIKNISDQLNEMESLLLDMSEEMNCRQSKAVLRKIGHVKQILRGTNPNDGAKLISSRFLNFNQHHYAIRN